MPIFPSGIKIPPLSAGGKMGLTWLAVLESLNVWCEMLARVGRAAERGPPCGGLVDSAAWGLRQRAGGSSTDLGWDPAVDISVAYRVATALSVRGALGVDRSEMLRRERGIQ